MDIRKLMASLKRRGYRVPQALAIVGVFAIIGVLAMQSSGAATYAVNKEAETGTIAGLASAVTDANASGGQAVKFGQASSLTWPATPAASGGVVCGQTILNGGPTTAPAGAVTVPAGNNSSMDLEQDNKTYWFAAGVHTLGTSQYSQITPGNNTVYIGAPGAIIDGQGINNYAFTGRSTNVTIKYLTIRNFISPRDEGTVNHDAGENWTIEYNTITNNGTAATATQAGTGGAALMGSRNGTYQFNCIKDNGQYAVNSCCDFTDSIAGEISGFKILNNEIVGNNIANYEPFIEGCGCTGGVKLWLNSNVDFMNNYVHDNHGTGLWLDNNNRGVKVQGNYFGNNEGMGFFAEAGYDFEVKYNNFVGNSVKEGRDFASNGDPFPVGAIYISESGSPTGYGLRFVPSVISNNNFDNNWGGVELWENPNRYAGSNAHTHVSGTIKINNLYDPGICDGTGNTIPASVGDKYRCRWSTENVIVENNIFRIDKAAIGANCVGTTYCGVSGIFSTSGCCDYAWPTFEIPWFITFKQSNIFRNNTYKGDWRFAGWETSNRTSWNNWRATAPAVPTTYSSYSPPSTFGQDAGSTLTTTP